MHSVPLGSHLRHDQQKSRWSITYYRDNNSQLVCDYLYSYHLKMSRRRKSEPIDVDPSYNIRQVAEWTDVQECVQVLLHYSEILTDLN